MILLNTARERSERNPGGSMHLGSDRWAGLLAAAAVVAAVADPDPVRRGVVVLACAAAALGLRTYAARSLARELDRLGQAAERLVRGDLETPIPPADRVRGVAARLEAARRAVVDRVRRVETQRDGLAEYLALTDSRLRDPAAEARRQRLSRCDNVRVELLIGSETSDATLVDLGLDQAVLATEAAPARRLVPGLPLRVRIHVGDAHLTVMASAVGPAPTDDGTQAWVVRFPERLDAADLPGELGAALVTRASDRVRPTRDVPATATLLAPFGAVPAVVGDVSNDGVGLVVALGPELLGDLERQMVVRLVFPSLGRVAVVDCELCTVNWTGPAARLGLRFVGHQPAEREMIAEFLRTALDGPQPVVH